MNGYIGQKITGHGRRLWRNRLRRHREKVEGFWLRMLSVLQSQRLSVG
jgi:hypothetical protein